MFYRKSSLKMNRNAFIHCKIFHKFYEKYDPTFSDLDPTITFTIPFIIISFFISIGNDYYRQGSCFEPEIIFSDITYCENSCAVCNCTKCSLDLETGTPKIKYFTHLMKQNRMVTLTLTIKKNQFS